MPLPPFIPATRPVHRKRKLPTAGPPPVLHQILSVQSEGDGTDFEAWVSAELASIVNEPALIELSVDGSVWVGVSFAVLDDDDHSHLFLVFDQDLSDATLWRVSVPADWVFVDGGVLGAPLSGAIES